MFTVVAPHPLRSTLVSALLLLAGGCATDTDFEDGLGERTRLVVPTLDDVVLRESGTEVPAREIVIRDFTAWQRYWSEWRRVAIYQIPPIDFSKDMVLYVVLGERGSTGYSVTIDSVAVYDNAIIADVTEHTPGRCGAFAVLTFPAVAVRLPASPGVVRFRRHVVAGDCR